MLPIIKDLDTASCPENISCVLLRNIEKHWLPLECAPYEVSAPLLQVFNTALVKYLEFECSEKKESRRKRANFELLWRVHAHICEFCRISFLSNKNISPSWGGSCLFDKGANTHTQWKLFKRGWLVATKSQISLVSTGGKHWLVIRILWVLHPVKQRWWYSGLASCPESEEVRFKLQRAQ